ncbi:plasmid mobilization protein [Aeromonas rivipollensis]
MNDKTKQLNIRMTMKDYDLLNKQRKILQMSQVDFVSHIINNGINQIIEVTNPDLIQSIGKVEKVLGSYGNNLNQLAKHLNSGNSLQANGLLLLEKIHIELSALNKIFNKEKITIKEDI